MSMPKRPKQHQVEDLSINALKNVLPRELVYREKDKDYGIDGEIEIFDEKDCVTGIIFLVQLKATDTDDLKKQKRVQLSTESIKRNATFPSSNSNESTFSSNVVGI